MRTLVVGLWKEWRDCRGIALALLVALPVLAFTAAWAFGGDIPKASFGGLTLFVVTVAQALYVLAVASESFGGERRRETLTFVRRLPRGLGRAFAAKCTAYVVGSVLACAWGAVVAWTACRVFGPERAVGDFAQLLLQPDPLTTTLALALFVLGLWTLFMSNMVPQGGAATVAAGLLLGMLGVPVYLALKDHHWLLQMPGQDAIRLGLGALAVVAVAALAVAFLRGCRFLGGIWAPAWRGLSVVLVVAGGGYAWGAVALDRALTIDPRDPEFTIAEHGYLGTGGRYLYVNVHRGWNAWTPWHDQDGVELGTPMQPWIVDLHDGSWRVAGEYLQGWGPLVWNNTKVPQPIVRRHDAGRDEQAWFDGETGELRKVLPSDVRTPDIQAWQRSKMPALAWHKDDQGRALWLEGDRLVRDGEDAPYEKWFKGKGEPWYAPHEGGWLATSVVLDKQSGTAHSAWRVFDAASGSQHDWDRVGGGGWVSELVLSTRFVLRRMYTKVPRDQKSTLLPWVLVSLKNGEQQPTVNPPEAEHLLRALPGERALVLVGDRKGARTLSIWDPRSGEIRPVLNENPAPNETAGPITGHSAHVLASVPGGLSVVRVTTDRESYGSTTTYLLREHDGGAWRLPLLDAYGSIVCIENERSVVAIHHRRQVVRLERGPCPDGSEAFGATTLFPR